MAATRRPACIGVRSTMLVAVLICAFALCIMGICSATPSQNGLVQQANAAVKIKKGVYSKTVGGFDSWGKNKPIKKMGYILSLCVEKVKDKKVTFYFEQARFWGVGGSYTCDSRTITKKLKRNKATFTFKTGMGDKCKATIRFVSSKKVKVRIKTLTSGNERHPLTTGYKWRTLKYKKRS